MSCLLLAASSNHGSTRAAEPKSLVVDGGASGVLTLEDMNAKADESEDPQSPPGMAAIEGILDACKAQFWERLRAHGGDTAGGPDALGRFGYFAFLGVAQRARRRGVGAVLVKRACVELRDQGYVYGIAFCTSHVSAALFAAQGFQRWGGVHYHAFTMPDGSHPFASLPDDECAVMVRDLRAGGEAA